MWEGVLSGLREVLPFIHLWTLYVCEVVETTFSQSSGHSIRPPFSNFSLLKILFSPEITNFLKICILQSLNRWKSSVLKPEI